MNAPMRQARYRGRSTALLWVLAGLVAAALVVGAVAGALRQPAALDPHTPEGTVQAYLQAVLDGEYGDANGHLSAETAERCGRQAFRDAWVPESLTATLEDVQVRGAQSQVRVRLRSASGPSPFGGGPSSFTETFTLVEEDGAWRLAEHPWPLHHCPEAR